MEIGIEGVVPEHDADTRWDLRLNLCHLGKDDVASCLEDCAEKNRLGGCGSHPCDHEGKFA